MRHNRILQTCLLAGFVGILAGTSRALAQGFDPSEVQSRPAMTGTNGNVTTIVDPTIRRGYSYRVTTGAHTTAGWEQKLVEGDPNLRHWTWVPVTNYDQGYVRVEPGKDRNGQPTYQRPAGGVYVKPIKVALPQRQYPWKLQSPRQAIAAVSAKVSAPRHYDTPTYAYAHSYRNSGAGNVCGSLTSQDVYGKIVSRGITH